MGQKESRFGIFVFAARIGHVGWGGCRKSSIKVCRAGRVTINTATIPFFYRAVEPDSLIAVLRHFSRFAN